MPSRIFFSLNSLLLFNLLLADPRIQRSQAHLEPVIWFRAGAIGRIQRVLLPSEASVGPLLDLPDIESGLSLSIDHGF